MRTRLQHRLYMRKWLKKLPNKKKKVLGNAKYYRKNRKRILAACARYRKKHHTKILAWARKNHRRRYLRHFNNPVRHLTHLFRKAVKRAKKRGCACHLRVLDLLRANPPKQCACCHRRIEYGCGRGKQDRAPSLDRRNNSQGYTVANTFVVCRRCNEIKRDATASELEAIVRYMR